MDGAAGLSSSPVERGIMRAIWRRKIQNNLKWKKFKFLKFGSEIKNLKSLTIERRNKKTAESGRSKYFNY